MQERSGQSNLCTWGIAPLNVSDITSSTAANWERYHMLNLCSTLNTFFHQGSTTLAGAHVTARTEQDIGLAIGANNAFLDLLTIITSSLQRYLDVIPILRSRTYIVYLQFRKNIFSTDQTFFHSWCTNVATGDMSARAEKHFAFSIGANQTFVDCCRWCCGFDVVPKDKGSL